MKVHKKLCQKQQFFIPRIIASYLTERDQTPKKAIFELRFRKIVFYSQVKQNQSGIKKVWEQNCKDHVKIWKKLCPKTHFWTSRAIALWQTECPKTPKKSENWRFPRRHFRGTRGKCKINTVMQILADFVANFTLFQPKAKLFL